MLYRPIITNLFFFFYSIAASLHACNNVTVPSNMYCYADADTSYKIDCLRNCSTDCLEDQSTDPVCASDLGTYDGSCDMKVRCLQVLAFLSCFVPGYTGPRAHPKDNL